MNRKQSVTSERSELFNENVEGIKNYVALSARSKSRASVYWSEEQFKDAYAPVWQEYYHPIQ